MLHDLKIIKRGSGNLRKKIYYLEEMRLSEKQL